MNKNEQSIWLMYGTFPNRTEALSIARKLLESKLIACANVIGGVTSVYHWEGKLCEEEEVILIAKTTTFHRQKALDTLVSLHTYDTPCATLIPISESNPAFAQWVNQQLAN